MPEDRQMAMEWIEEAVLAGARQVKACAILELAVRTLQRWKKRGQADGHWDDQRKTGATVRTPANKLSVEERTAILAVCHRPEYQSLSPSQIVPRLADRGKYMASESSFYRVLRDADQGHRRSTARAPRTGSKPKGFKATGPNQVWSWDISFLATSLRGAFYRLYLVLDIFSRKIVGWEVHEYESAEQASVLIRKACLAEGIQHDGLVLHADNGGPMKGATMLATLQQLGVVPSFSRPAVSDDNPYSESLFRTLKYTPAYPSQPFASLEAARTWMQGFVQWYNDTHRHSGIRYVTPSQRHRGEDQGLLKQREAVYEAAKQRNPKRWAGKTRNWKPVPAVWLNPPKEHQRKTGQTLKVA